MKQMTWEDHQAWELNWHNANSNCANSYNEETKQYTYAHHMGLDEFATNNFGAKGWDFGNRSVLDVGGGPYSILLKSKAKRKVVLDPLEYPNWTQVRYKECGVEVIKAKAEDIDTVLKGQKFSTVLMYNVLQHVENPQKILSNVRKICEIIYFFDWIGIGDTAGHPNVLNAKDLDSWLGEKGSVLGSMYYGSFEGDLYYGKNPQ